MEILHFTTVHPRTDIRIRIKQAASLRQMIGVSVALYVQDGLGNAFDSSSGVQIVDTGPRSGSRLVRMVQGSWRMWRAVRKARPQVAHFHDPELIPVGFALKLSGIKVVYDVHEDVPRQILTKHYLPMAVRKPAALCMEALEWLAGHCFDAIVPATPKISERFPAQKTVTVQNFPILEELVAPEPVPYEQRPPHFAYVGAITNARGAREMVEAIGLLSSGEARLCLAGAFSPNSLQSETEVLPGWGKVKFLGWVDRTQVAALLGNVRAGLVLLHPTQRYPDAYPVKMFEYMAAGLPVIASDFELWRQIVEGAGCGLLVNPLDPEEIAEAILWILEHPLEAEVMGQQGRIAAEERYNWAQEEGKLVSLYKKLL